MSLQLITGPANAAKAGKVLGAFRDHAEAGNAPVLVVPTAADRDSYEIELLADGALIGGRVVTWEGLVSLLARRLGVGEKLIGPLRRRTLVRKAIESVADSLETLDRSAATVGFTTALESLFREFGRAALDAHRLGEADADPEDARRRDVVALLASYESELARAGVSDRERQALAVLDKLEESSDAWDGRPVLAYGFSELTVVQRRVMSALSRECQVVVSLPADGRGKVGLAEHTVEAFQRAMQGRVDIDRQESLGTPEGPRLLEPLLFSGAARGAASAAVDSIAVLVGSGTVAAAELIAIEVAHRVAAGVSVDQVVVVKPPRLDAGPISAALRGHGFESSAQQTVEFAATALGSALLGLLRCELDAERASSADALAWVTAVSDRDGSDQAEFIDRQMRARGDGRASRLLERWSRETGAKPQLQGSLRAASTKPLLAGAVKTAARQIFTGLIGEPGQLLRVDQAEQAAALSAVTIGMSDVVDLFDAADARTMIDELATLPVQLSDGAARPGVVLITDALSIRGRSFNTVIACGLEDGMFPASFTPDPFLDDVAAEGLADSTDRLSASEAHAGAEREQFVICAARATERLVLVRRSTDDSGSDVPRSPFLDEAMRLLGRGFDESDARRRAGSVGADAGARGELRSAAKEAGGSVEPAAPARLGAAAAAAVTADLGSVSSPTRIESYTQCPAKWLAEIVLNPADFEEKPEAMELGTIIHEALEAAVVCAINGNLGPITEANLPAVQAAVEASLAESESRLATTVSARLRIAQARRLVRDWLDWEVTRADGWEPHSTEMKFAAGSEVEPIDLGDGLTVTGSVDRVDVASAEDGTRFVVIRDYKSGSSYSGKAKGHNAANRKLESWNDERFPVFQAPLYLKAASEHFGLPAGGAFYEMMGDRTRHGGLVGEAVGARSAVDSIVTRVDLERAIDDAVQRAKEIVGAMAAGEVAPAEDCDCPHPWLCGRRI